MIPVRRAPAPTATGDTVTAAFRREPMGARQGLSLGEIAQQLGHADVRMSQRYAHLCQQTLANKIRQMPAMGIYEIVPQPEPRTEPKPQTDKVQ